MGAGGGASPPHVHLAFLQFNLQLNLHFNFSMKFPQNGDTFKHTWHLQGFDILAGFTMLKLFVHLSSIGANTCGTTVLHIFIGAAGIGGNGFGLTITDLHKYVSSAIGCNPQLQLHALPFN